MARIGKGIQSCLSWIHQRDGRVPSNAIDAGHAVYIARIYHSGDLIPEYEFDSYEVLCDTKLPHGPQQCYKWERHSNGYVPKYAVVGGITSSNEPLYIAREYINGERVVGKVHESHECAYFPYGGQERKMHHYEVLVLIK
ncbi:hypothetical protein MS3_00005253 [Schistosoma haematobium]|uniref:DM9 domain-containing protein n=1 Tax=Schistosoma haematobium TaxID=6185 RepID=A0A922S578_SCHHA|nr:hypothetical protein MS3_00005253 [Schistosoma haematobium]KAH9594305.1 hypothetical protein MS3_00005253 [Schistosoma haematobium]CAH8441062.1 unnamed protein product [Schistosoma intercalatum]